MTKDKDIRAELHKHLKKKYPKAVILDELQLSATRADIAVITDIGIHGYEIKSCKDVWTNLEHQAPIYDNVFDTCTLVLGAKKIENSRKVVDFLYQHEHWGIMSAREKNGKVVVADIFGTWQNPRQDLVELCMLVSKDNFRDVFEAEGIHIKDVRYHQHDKFNVVKRAIEIIGEDKLKKRLLSYMQHIIPDNRYYHKQGLNPPVKKRGRMKPRTLTINKKMRYLGNKQKYGKEIYNAIVEDITGGLFGGGRELPKNWVEPFVGSGGMIENVPPTFNRYGNDKNKYIIAMHKAVQNGWLPPDSISEDEYKHIKDNKDSYPPELVGFVGFACAFGCVFFDSYAKGVENGIVRDYLMDSKKALKLSKPQLQTVVFTEGDYRSINIPDNSIVYCDPPYEGVRSGYGQGKFNHQEFYKWLGKIKSDNVQVYLSEYKKPKGGVLVWQKDVSVTVNTTKTTARTERLYKLPMV